MKIKQGKVKGPLTYHKPRLHVFQNCKHCGIMVSRDTAAVRKRGSVPADDKYNTTECAICRRNESYKWRESRRKNK